MSTQKSGILYLCADTGIPLWGTKGGSIHMREFLANIAKFGYSIDVIARDAISNGKRIGQISYHDLIETPVSDLTRGDAEPDKSQIRQAELDRFELNGQIEEHIEKIYSRSGFDLIYERYSLFNLSGLQFAKKRGLPFILEVNAPLIEEAEKYRHLHRRDLALFTEKRLFSDSDHIIAVSDEVRNYIIGIAPNARVTVVPNGVTIERFAEFETSQTSREYLTKFEKSDFVVGFVGSLKPWHGVEILIDAFAELPSDDGKNGLLIVGGKGKLKSELKEMCNQRGLRGRVKFTGPVEHHDIPALLARTDVLTAPYPNLDDFYFSALKIFEYMAAGKAIVASSIGQIENTLTHEQNSLLVTPGDPTALRDALLRLKNDPQLRRRLGENALKDAREKHSWQSRLERVHAIFRDLIDSKQIKAEKKI